MNRKLSADDKLWLLQYLSKIRHSYVEKPIKERKPQKVKKEKPVYNIEITTIPTNLHELRRIVMRSFNFYQYK